VTDFFVWEGTRPVALTGFRDLVKTFATRFFAEVAVALGFGLALRTFAAFFARAFPAGERLVAGLRRVDLPATTRFREDDVAVEWREEERDASFFKLLAMGLLMRKALDSQDDSPQRSPQKTGGA
jgi:hypothetical protein